MPQINRPTNNIPATRRPIQSSGTSPDTEKRNFTMPSITGSVADVAKYAFSRVLPGANLVLQSRDEALGRGDRIWLDDAVKNVDSWKDFLPGALQAPEKRYAPQTTAGKVVSSGNRFLSPVAQDAIIKPIARAVLSGAPQVIKPIAKALNIDRGEMLLDPTGVAAQVLGTDKLSLYDVGRGLDPNSKALSEAKILNDAINVGTSATLGGGTAIKNAAARILGSRTTMATANIDKVASYAPALSRAGMGSLLGLQFGLEDDDTKASTSARNALIGGIAAGAIPPIFGSSFRWLSQKTGDGWKVLSPKISSALERAEDYATRSGADLIEKRPDAIKDVVRGVSFERNGKQKVAGGIVKFADWLKTRNQMLLDDMAPLGYKNISNRLKQQGVDVDEAMDLELMALEDQARRSSGVASVQSAEYSDQLNKLVEDSREVSPDFPEIVSGMLLQYDELGRSKQGLLVREGKSTSDIESLIKSAENAMSEKELSQLNAVRNFLQTDNIRQLNDLKNNGLISEESMKEMLELYPDYIPHQVMVNKVKKSFDEGVGSGFFDKRSKNVQRDLIQKAEGSLRDLKDPFQALQIKNQVVNSAIQKQKTINAYIDFAKKFPDAFPDVKGLRTAEEVELRIGLLSGIKENNIAQKQTLSAISELRNKSNALVKKMKEVQASNTKAIREGQKSLTENTRKEITVMKNSILNIQNKLDNNINKALNKETPNSISIIQENIIRNTEELSALIDEASTKASEWDAPSEINAVLQKADTREKKIQHFSSKLEKEIQKFDSIQSSMLLRNMEASRRLEGFIKNVDDYGEDRLRTLIQDETARINRQSAKDITRLSDAVTSINKTKKLLNEIAKEKSESAKEVRKFINSLKEISPNKLAKQERQIGTINRFNRGIYESWQVPKDIEVAFKGLDSQQIVGLMRHIVTANRIMRAGATGKNIGFAFPNFFRDVQTVQMTTEQGFALDALARSLFGEDPALLRQLKKDGVFFETNIQDAGIKPFQQKKIKALQDNGLMKIVKMTGDTPDMIESIITKMENAVRYSAVEQAKRNGVTNMEQLRAIAKNSTVDFGKAGIRMRTLNQLVPFLNARVQGTANVFKAMKNNPERFAEMALWTGVYPELRLYQHNRDFETYPNISSYITDNYWVYVFGEIETIDEAGNEVKVPQFISIPKGESQKLISNPFNYMLRSADNTNTRATGEMLAETLMSMSPLTFQALTTKGMLSGIISSFGPVGRMITGNMTGYDPFTNLPIVPDYLADAPKEFQKKRTTPKATEELADLIGVSPAMLQFNIESLGAGVGKDLMSILSIPLEKNKNSGISNTDFGKVTQTPIVRSFAREAGDYNSPENVRLREYIKATKERVGGTSAADREIKNEIKKDLVKYKTLDERLTSLREMISNEVVSVEMGKEIIEEITSGLTPTMSQIKSEGVDNWARAEIIYNHTKDLPEKDATEFLVQLKNKKILSDKVMRQLLLLRQTEGVIPE